MVTTATMVAVGSREVPRGGHQTDLDECGRMFVARVGSESETKRVGDLI
jgi:hypothetical protein